MATTTAASGVRKLFENSSLLVVLSRHGAKEIACSAVLGAEEAFANWNERPRADACRHSFRAAALPKAA
jgi:hypothetical protein